MVPREDVIITSLKSLPSVNLLALFVVFITCYVFGWNYGNVNRKICQNMNNQQTFYFAFHPIIPIMFVFKKKLLKNMQKKLQITCLQQTISSVNQKPPKHQCY